MIFGEGDDALLGLLAHLSLFRYRFVTPTPETHRRVVARPARAEARDLRDIFGWNVPFSSTFLPPPLLDRLERLEIIRQDGNLYRSQVRVSSVDERLFIHSAYPTVQDDAVFLGPDSYRFVNFVRAGIRRGDEVRHLVDIGAGAGVGAIMAAPLVPNARITLVDVNPLALRFALINARYAGVEVELVEGRGIDAVDSAFDRAIANPPFLADAQRRIYRDGGEMLGGALSLEWGLAAARAVAPGVRVLLYSGSAIVDGVDRLEEGLRAGVAGHNCTLDYAELDPDIFGEELDQPGYRDVERIAAVGAVIDKAA